MEEWITIKTYTYPHDAYATVSKLEYEGISCQLKDENTLLADNLLSAAIGGVKLQVLQSDVENALLVLGVSGVLPDQPALNPLLKKLDEWSLRIPILRSLKFLPRILSLGTLGLATMTTLLLFIFLLNSDDALNGTSDSHYWHPTNEKQNHFFQNVWPVIDSLSYTNPAEALEMIEHTQKLYPFHQMDFEKGNAYMALGDFEAAISAYLNNLDSTHKDFQGRVYWLASCYDSLAIYDSMEHYYKLALKSVNRSTIVFNNPFIAKLEYSPLSKAELAHCHIRIGAAREATNNLPGARIAYVRAQKITEDCYSIECEERLAEVRRLLRSIRKRIAADLNRS